MDVILAQFLHASKRWQGSQYTKCIHKNGMITTMYLNCFDFNQKLLFSPNTEEVEAVSASF